MQEVSMHSTAGRCFSNRTALACFGLLLFVMGCGYAEYEQRLGETRKYYAYLDRIEQSLAPKPKWTDPQKILELRVPRQFVPIPPAPLIKKDDGTYEQPSIDPRQPDYLNLNFPELIGAWDSVFKVAKGNGVTEDHKGYIYALSNDWELGGERATDAGEFVSRLETYLTDTLQIPAAPQPKDRQPEIYPKTSPAYQVQLSYDHFSFPGKNINDTNYTFEVYSRKSGSVIGVLVLVLPEGIDTQQKINERIPMMLESFTVTPNPPTQASDKNSPAQGNPVQTAPGF